MTIIAATAAISEKDLRSERRLSGVRTWQHASDAASRAQTSRWRTKKELARDATPDKR
jgi:hypothetical protein